MDENEAVVEALRRYAAGEQPTFSTGICESLTCGYGECDQYGYWEFPLPNPESYLKRNPTGALDD